MKKHLMVFAVNLLVLLFSTGCYTKAPKQVIRVSTFSTDPVIVTILMKSFTEIEKGHPGVKIQLDDIPYNNYLEKILTEMAAGGAPDIISVEANNFVDLYLKGVFEDLTPYAQKEGVDPKAYYPGVMHRFSPDGKICALPTDTAPFGLVYYNKKIFNEAGVPYPTNKWKWPEPFLSICQKLVKKDAAGKITRWAFADPYGHSFDNFMFSNGGDYVDNPDHPTRMALDSPAALEAIHFRWDLMNTYHVAPTVTELQNFSMGASGAENMFINGFLAMMDSGIWHTPKFLEAKGLDFD
ncbi:MAG TPA: extracellular solute-binding protein, partial [bacterium]